MKNYTGKQIYLGIDVHKVTYAVTTICEGIVIKKATLRADPEGLVAFFRKNFKGAYIKSPNEAGFCGFHLHRILERNGITNLVVHAAGIEVAVGDRVKTDKRDSLKIATQLAANRLRGIRVPSEEREEKRAVTRVRDTMIEHRMTTANQIKALLHLHGLMPSEGKKICPKWIKSLKTTPMRKGIRFALDRLIDLWEQLTIQIKEIDAEMVKQAAEDHALETTYRSTPGIGPVSARILANEVEDMSYFDNERQLFSYTGLTPSEHSSGGHIRKGHISRQGKAVLRRVLILASWKAIREDEQLKALYDRIATRAGGKKAIVAVARHLIGHIRACFQKKCLYRTEVKAAVATAA
jgi:transposase